MIALIYQTLVLIFLGVLFTNLLWNLLTLRRISKSDRPVQFPFVSILVPARNEERTIGRLLESLAKQTYPSYEILVLDDQSEDRTREIVESFASRDPRVRLLEGKPLPAGWRGKCYACHQLAREAGGELLLFTDADTCHEPESVAGAVAHWENSGADLLTLATRLELLTFWEKLLLPLLPFAILTLAPPPGGLHRLFPRFAMANGQFLLFRRSAYEKIGGHEAVRDALVEDVWLARRLVRAGLRLVVRDGTGIVSVRMYQSFGEIWEGFSKNIFAGFEYVLPALALGLIFSFAAFAAPYFLLLAGLLFGLDFFAWVALPLLQIAAVFLMRLLIRFRSREGLWPIFLHPLALLLFIGIALDSAYRILSRRGAVWKGRSYFR